jgi:hypothetical protein
MSDEVRQAGQASAEQQELIRTMVSAMRAVKLYPPNNPIYSLSVRKSYEVLERYMLAVPQFTVGVQKTYFLLDQAPVGRDAALNRTIAQDLFGKGIREIVFHTGVTESEMLECFKALALTAEELALQSGIVSVLWEQGVSHIRVTEATLEEVITAPAGAGIIGSDGPPPKPLDAATAKKEIAVAGRTLVLGDLVNEPRKFGEQLLELARQTVGEHETAEDRLHELYQEAGRKVQEQYPEQGDTLFHGLARSVVEMDPSFRDRFISSKLYAHVDGDSLRDQREDDRSEVPEELHEIVTGRFSREWSVQQVATLLQKNASKPAPPKVTPLRPDQIEASPLPGDLSELARELADYSPDEMETLKVMGEMGMEDDIIEAAVRTLIFLIPLVRSPLRDDVSEKDKESFSVVVHQLEDLLTYLLKKKDYDLASLIVRSFHLPVDGALRPRLTEGMRKASSREVISAVIADMRRQKKGAPEYLSAYGYLLALDREATAVLLELLAAEKDRSIRRYLIDILKELGKGQIDTIGQRVSDSRWYFVRNIVSILGETRDEGSLSFLEKVMDHKQPQIRHEVIRGLINVGGKRAAGLLLRYLRDKEPDIQLMAVRGLAIMHGTGPDECAALAAFLGGRRIGKKDHELTVEAIKALGRIGDGAAAGFLRKYLKVRWWRSRRLQAELRDAAKGAIEEIGKRVRNGGSV